MRNNLQQGDLGLAIAPVAKRGLGSGLHPDVKIWALVSGVRCNRGSGRADLPWAAWVGRENDIAEFQGYMARQGMIAIGRTQKGAIERLYRNLQGVDVARLFRDMRGVELSDRYSIRIPHPAYELGPNGNRVHFHRKTKLKDEAKFIARAACLHAGIPQDFRPNRYDIIWYYKGPGPDDDNVVSRCKYSRDAVARYLGMDDRSIRIGEVQVVYSKPQHKTVDLVFYWKGGRP